MPHVLLKEHYRCHPEIIGFCNQRFYNNELIVLTKPESDRQPLMVYRTAPGNHARNRVNQRQIDVITNEVFPNQGLNASDGLVGSPCSPRDSQESSPTPQLKASILWCSAFFIVQLSHPYMTTRKTIDLNRRTFVVKVMSLLLNMLSRLVITFLPRSKHLFISWLQSPSAVILEPPKIKSDTVSTVSPSISRVN